VSCADECENASSWCEATAFLDSILEPLLYTMTDPVLAPSTRGARQARCGVWLFVPWFRDTQDCSYDLMEGNAIPTNHRFKPL